MEASLNYRELRAELARRGWRQRDLALAADLSVSCVNWICRGAAPGARATRQILEALGPEAASRVANASVPSPNQPPCSPL
jgi:transcriptional regulator with XRE-family HTH domain